MTLYRVVRASGGGPAWRRARSNPPLWAARKTLIFSRDADPTSLDLMRALPSAARRRHAHRGDRPAGIPTALEREVAP